MTSFSHSAYEVSQLLTLSVQIDCLAAFEEKLLVATRQGHLIYYSVAPRYGESKNDVQLIGYMKNFSKKPVQQLEVVPDYDLVVKLSDNVVSVHDLSLSSVPHIATLARTKGATHFTLDIEKNVSLTGEVTPTIRLGVVVKRNLQLYFLKNREFMDLGPDLNLADVPRTVSLGKQCACIGYKGAYSTISLTDKGKKQDLMGTGKQPEPIIIRLKGETDCEGFLCMKETQGFGFNLEGVLTRSIRFTDVPSDVAHDEPYLLGVIGDCVEIKPWNVDEAPDVKSLFVNKGRLVKVAKPGLAYVASSENIWLVQAEPIHKQIRLLLAAKQFELALKLAQKVNEPEEEKRNNVHHIQTLFAFDLFNSKKYDRAMKEFIKLNTDPYDVIKLFPELLVREDSSPKSESAPSDKDRGSGYNALIGYLTTVRANHLKEKDNDPRKSNQLMQIIDTTLLKCYLHTNDALVAPLLRRNFCNLEEAERLLKKHGKFSELIELYKTKVLHDRVLELMKKQANVEDSPFRGVDATIQYLQMLGKEHIELILDNCGWVLDAAPDDGLKIFTEVDIPEVVELPRPKILDFLLRTERRSLVIPYIEHAINTWKESSPIFHNALVHQYLERILSLGLKDPKAITLRAKLSAFLQSSDFYQPSVILEKFPSDCLFEERALMHGKACQHEQALSVYLLVLGDHSKAFDYCDHVYRKKLNDHDTVYITLLKLLLRPPDAMPGIDVALNTPPPSEALDTALNLLKAHPSRVNVVDALSLLPDDIPLSRLNSFLTASLRSSIYQRRSIQLHKGLLNAQRLRLKKEKMKQESKSFIITDVMVCSACKKRFGNQSAVVCYPNGDLLHYSCQGKVTAA